MKPIEIVIIAGLAVLNAISFCLMGYDKKRAA